MPKALEPGVRFPMALKSDQEKPIETRPVFWVAALAIREQEQLGEMVDKWYDKSNDWTTKEWFDKHVEFVLEHVESWDNMNDPETGEPIPFDDKGVRRVLSHQEARELVILFLRNAHLDDMEKKSLGSPPSLTPVSSASTAEGNAKTKEPILSP